MENSILALCQQALVAILVISAPASAAALATGLIVSILQTTTQVHEQTLSHLPKLVAVFVVLAIAGPWMLSQLVRLATTVFSQIPDVAAWQP